MSLILKRTLSHEADQINQIEETTGTVRYYIRLNPDIHAEGFWRECTSKEYFDTKQARHFGGLVETKTALQFYGDAGMKELEL